MRFTVQFYDAPPAADVHYKYAVIVARYQNQWIYCRHRERDTWEIPGGKNEPGEPIDSTARRELFEETGAQDFRIFPVTPYSVTEGSITNYGMLYFADVFALGDLPGYEIGRIQLFDAMPAALTYPEIQPHLLQRALVWLDTRSVDADL